MKDKPGTVILTADEVAAYERYVDWKCERAEKIVEQRYREHQAKFEKPRRK